jgi:hypothetical protein
MAGDRPNAMLSNSPVFEAGDRRIVLDNSQGVKLLAFGDVINVRHRETLLSLFEMLLLRRRWRSECRDGMEKTPLNLCNAGPTQGTLESNTQTSTKTSKYPLFIWLATSMHAFRVEVVRKTNSIDHIPLIYKDRFVCSYINLNSLKRARQAYVYPAWYNNNNCPKGSVLALLVAFRLFCMRRTATR